MFLGKRALVAALAALTVGGCGAPLDSFTGFCDGYAQALCDKLQACPQVPQPLPTECRPSISGSVCFCGMNAFSTGEEKYHGDKAQACLDAIAQEPCGSVSVDAPPPACSLVYGLASGAKPHCPPMTGPYPDAGSSD